MASLGNITGSLRIIRVEVGPGQSEENMFVLAIVTLKKLADFLGETYFLMCAV